MKVTYPSVEANTESSRETCPTKLNQQLARCNTMFLYQRSLNPTAATMLYDRDITTWFFQLKSVVYSEKLQGAYQFSGLLAKCLLVWLWSII